jgi:cytoskeletal protein CcmA (bactofilin family)
MADRQPQLTPPQRRFTDDREGFASVLGRDLTVEGSMRGATDLEIWGSFEGDMQLDGLVWMRPGSRFVGELQATDLVIEGELRGTVHATGKVDMRATCRIEADVTAARVAAAEGSHIEGRITVSGDTGNVVGYAERRGS